MKTENCAVSQDSMKRKIFFSSFKSIAMLEITLNKKFSKLMTEQFLATHPTDKCFDTFEPSSMQSNSDTNNTDTLE